MLGLYFDTSSLGVETIIQFESNAMSPPVMKLIINKHFKVDVTVIGEVNELDFKKIPVVESKVIGIDLLIQTEPSERRSGFQLGLWKFVVWKFANMWIFQGGRLLLEWAGRTFDWEYTSIVLLDEYDCYERKR